MSKVLIATEKPFAAEATAGIRDIIEQAGYEVVLLEKYASSQDLINAAADVDALIIRSDNVDAAVLAAAKKLKIVVRAGAGYDNIDLAACNERKIVAMNTPGQNSNAVAELIFGMMIYMARSAFDGGSGTELRGKTFGVHGFGAIGKALAPIASGFGMKVLAYDVVSLDIAKSKYDVTMVKTPAELYRACKYVSINIPGLKENLRSINYELMNSMPSGATLINTARKDVVCEASLMKVMEERKDFKYVADVMPDNGAELAAKYGKRFFATPKKQGAQTAEANVNAGFAAAAQVVSFLKDGITRYQVNKF